MELIHLIECFFLKSSLTIFNPNKLNISWTCVVCSRTIVLELEKQRLQILRRPSQSPDLRLSAMLVEYSERCAGISEWNIIPLMGGKPPQKEV